VSSAVRCSTRPSSRSGDSSPPSNLTSIAYGHSHPNLTRKLESLYHDAYPNRAITTVGLIGFAIERKLLLTGDPHPQSAHSA
jgi:hypothetical protein